MIVRIMALVMITTGLLSGCKKLDSLTQFNLDYNTQVTIAAGTGSGLPLDLFAPEVVTNSEGEFSANNTHKDRIETINLKELKLSILAPAGHNFDFLKDVEVFLGADGLPEIKVAWVYNVPDGLTGDLPLAVAADTDLKEYIKKDAFKIRVRAVTDKFVSENVRINTYTRFFVDAKVLGV